MPYTLTRNRFTWLAYCLLAYYGYWINVLGPITPFLKDELGLSYTVSSLHFSAFAVGILIVGLAGHRLIERIGRMRALWFGTVGASLGSFLLVAGQSPLVTVGAALLMGVTGSFILAVVPAALSDLHGSGGAAAISEANVVASVLGVAAPLLVGWLARTAPGWRLALGSMALAPILLWLLFRQARLSDATQAEQSAQHGAPLPALFWFYWSAIVLSEAAEYCMIFWSADYLQGELGLLKADAALAVSLFLGAMIAGRLAGSWLVRRFAPRSVVSVSILMALAGFMLFWTASLPAVGLVGLFITGLGIASLYPLTLALAIGSAPGNTVQAGARASLSTGMSILVLPLVLGRLADAIGIRPAYGMVVALLVLALALVQITGRLFPARQPDLKNA